MDIGQVQGTSKLVYLYGLSTKATGWHRNNVYLKLKIKCLKRNWAVN